MRMSIDEAIRDLVYLKGCGIFPFNYGTDAKQLTIATDECIAVAIDAMRKYQLFQLDYETRLKADMVAILEELKKEMNFIKECEYQIYGKEHWNFVGKCQDVVQQKINALKGDKDESIEDNAWKKAQDEMFMSFYDKASRQLWEEMMKE